MRSSVFIKTHRGDIQWIPWVFRFLKKNWLSDSEFVVSAPFDCSEELKEMQSILGKEIRLAEFDQWDTALSHRVGWMHQQYIKHHADLYCHGDFITFLDSDCILRKTTDFDQHLMIGNMPVMWYAEYSKIHAPWHIVVRHFLGLEIPYEFMRCFPLTYHKNTITKCREHLESIHGKPLHIVMRNDARAWSEFNIIGSYAFVFQKELYHWKNTYDHPMFENEIYRHDRVRQFHNVYDWQPWTEPYLAEMYGEPIPELVTQESTV